MCTLLGRVEARKFFLYLFFIILDINLPPLVISLEKKALDCSSFADFEKKHFCFQGSFIFSSGDSQ